MMILRNIRLDEKTDCYIAIEAGAKYEIAPDLYTDLERFLKLNHKLLVADWYRQLSAEHKIKVQCQPQHGM